jgi:hypothetical protein
MKTLLIFHLLFAGFQVMELSSTAQTIATFNSLEASGQGQNLVLPATHTFQRLIRTGDVLSLGGNLGNNPDFTAYVPINGSSTQGYLSISSETAPAECAILNLLFDNASRLWGVTNGGKVSLPASDLGVCAAFCSGTVTSRNTVIVGEEVAPFADVNGDGYDDLGWLIEIDPATRSVINQDGVGGVDKLWAMGRQAHENVAIRKDQAVAYWGADNSDNGYLYKFVPTVPGNFSAGSLYVLRTTGALGTGSWMQVSNTTKVERNNTIGGSINAGAYNFQRIEDVDIGPDGRIYFASTATGCIYRFNDTGTTVNGLEVFVENTTYDVDGPGPFAPVKFEWPDNLAFDGEGNLWVLQDGGDNHIWVVAPSHTTSTPAIKVFANTPTGAEPTGITFSPDFLYLFISFQHPSPLNTASQPDAAGRNVIFDAGTTLVIARKENLGASILSQVNENINLALGANGVEINWVSNLNAGTFEIERSVDGIHFDKIANLPATLSNSNYSYADKDLQAGNQLYYRLRVCNSSRLCSYSDTKTIRNINGSSFKVYPLSAQNAIRVMYNAKADGELSIVLFTASGSEVYRQKIVATRGPNDFTITPGNLPAAIYVLQVTDGEVKESRRFAK